MFPLNFYGRVFGVFAFLAVAGGVAHAARYNVIYGPNGINSYSLITPTNPAAPPMFMESHTPVTAIPNNPNYNGYTYNANAQGGVTGATEVRLPLGASGSAPVTLLENIAKPTLIAAVARVLGGPAGMATAIAMPYLAEWIHNGGLELSPDGQSFLMPAPTDPTVCTTAPCYSWHINGYSDIAYLDPNPCGAWAAQEVTRLAATGATVTVTYANVGASSATCSIHVGSPYNNWYDITMSRVSVAASAPLARGTATVADILSALNQNINTPPGVAVDLQNAGQPLASDAGLASGPSNVSGPLTQSTAAGQTTSNTTSSTAPTGSNSSASPVTTTNTVSTTNTTNNTVTNVTTNTTSNPNNGPVTTNITTTVTTAPVTTYKQTDYHMTYGSGTAAVETTNTTTSSIGPNPLDPDTTTITKNPSDTNPNTTPETIDKTTEPTEPDCVRFPDRLGCATFGQLPTSETLSKLEIPVSVTALVFAHAACPAPISFTAFAHSYEFPFDPFCVQLERIRVLLMALATLGAAYILADSFRIS